jgi:hypothetical protein
MYPAGSLQCWEEFAKEPSKFLYTLISKTNFNIIVPYAIKFPIRFSSFSISN